LEKIRLKTVRPFVMRDIVLSEVPRFAKKAADTSKEAVIKYLREQVEECIEEANKQWYQSQVEYSQDLTPPLPLIRIRVEYSGAFEVENPQRFSNRFVGKVANTTDVVLFYRKRKLATGVKRASATIIDEAEIGEEEETDEQIIRVEALVKEFLSAQTLSVLEENGLGQAIESYVDKDDKRALQDFIDDTLKEHVEVSIFISTPLTLEFGKE
jgi:double-strand break repair protein MRE11